MGDLASITPEEVAAYITMASEFGVNLTIEEAIRQLRASKFIDVLEDEPIPSKSR